jgi:hypothetical protein
MYTHTHTHIQIYISLCSQIESLYSALWKVLKYQYRSSIGEEEARAPVSLICIIEGLEVYRGSGLFLPGLWPLLPRYLIDTDTSRPSIIQIEIPGLWPLLARYFIERLNGLKVSSRVVVALAQSLKKKLSTPVHFLCKFTHCRYSTRAGVR